MKSPGDCRLLVESSTNEAKVEQDGSHTSVARPALNRRLSLLPQSTDRTVTHIVRPRYVSHYLACLPANDCLSALMSGQFSLRPRMTPLAFARSRKQSISLEAKKLRRSAGLSACLWGRLFRVRCASCRRGGRAITHLTFTPLLAEPRAAAPVLPGGAMD